MGLLVPIYPIQILLLYYQIIPEIFRIKGNFNSSVTVDTKEYTVKDGQGKSLIPKWEGDMPELQHGTNTFKAQCFQSQITVTVEYLERML